MDRAPAYLALLDGGELDRRASRAWARLAACDLCPWECRVDRRATPLAAGPTGARCRSGRQAVVAGCYPHFAQEACLSGSRGSGAIYFAGCSLACFYCINPSIRRAETGAPVSPRLLAAQMLYLQACGCHNLNWITPTHVLPQALAALCLAARRGLRLPLVYKSSGFERVEVLRDLLDGVVDIYMPDLKHISPAAAGEGSGAAAYPNFARAALLEMHRQVGDLELDGDGLACRGLLVTHLVLPGRSEESRAVFEFLAASLPPGAAVSLPPYRPNGEIGLPAPFDRPIPPEEHRRAIALAQACGLRVSSLTPPFREGQG